MVRILLDENVPCRSADHLPEEHEVSTVQQHGWSGKRNGELLSLAENDFNCFITMDQGIAYQQNLTAYELTIIVLCAGSNRLIDLLPLIPLVIESLKTL
ncbi:MAG: DUF5615 family PIN-like protein [Pirellulales bacterium]|nr:DUF5615 family PIN-like protein [Pirellulales bacterium]